MFVLALRNLTIWKSKVLEVDVGTRIQLPRRLNERINELVVLLSTNAPLLEPEV